VRGPLPWLDNVAAKVHEKKKPSSLSFGGGSGFGLLNHKDIRPIVRRNAIGHARILGSAPNELMKPVVPSLIPHLPRYMYSFCTSKRKKASLSLSLSLSHSLIITISLMFDKPKQALLSSLSGRGFYLNCQFSSVASSTASRVSSLSASSVSSVSSCSHAKGAAGTVNSSSAT